MSFELNKDSFRTVFLGYDKDQVDTLHEKALAAFEKSELEITRLNQDLAQVRTELDSRKKDERFVQEAIVSAQRTADEIRIAAQRHADLVVLEARDAAEAERALAKEEVTKMNREVDQLRQERKRFIEDFRLLLEKYQKELHMVVHTEPMEIGPA